MAFLGKEFKFEKDENLDSLLEILQAAGLQAEALSQYKEHKPVVKLEKEGDTYVYTTSTPAKTKVVKFQSGKGFEEEIKDGIKIYNVCTVDSSSVTQVVKRTPDSDKFITLKRDFNGNKMTITVTASFWDGTAYRYYSA